MSSSPDPYAASVEAIRRDVISASGATESSVRSEILAGGSPPELHAFLEKVRYASYRVTDEDIHALRRAGLSEDAIYEVTVAAVVGIASDRLDAAKRVLGGGA